MEREGKRYYIKRSELNRMKKKYQMENESDHEFLAWWRRNRGTGYEDPKLVYIDESR
ncbi:MAG: hypothetical protein QW687_01550 [Candidatus Hadarchaeales archaeon]